MPPLVPKRPRTCTHIKVAGQKCESPALRGEFFCYFHTRVIKGVQQRVDMQLHSMALLEDSESIQLSLMHVVDGLLKGTLDPTRARLIIQALRIAARNAKSVRFEAKYDFEKETIVREVPNYAHQYLIEHPEFGPPLSARGADTPVRKPATHAVAAPEARTEPTDRKAPAAPATAQTVSAKRIAAPAAERQKNAAHGASRGTKAESNPAPRERKKSPMSQPKDSEEYERIKRAEAAIPGAMAGNWRDLRTVFEFAGITEQNKDAPS